MANFVSAIIVQVPDLESSDCDETCEASKASF